MSVGYAEKFEDGEAPWSDLSENSNESSRSSSTQSWIDDSEHFVTKELKEQYEKFEEALYSERSPDDLPKSLQSEVKIWSEHSPHIRVRGVKAHMHERPENFREEEEYDNSYEEIIETHGSLEESLEKSLSFNEDVKEVIDHFTFDQQQIIKTDLKNAIVGKLFDHALPRVLQKFEPVIKSASAGKRKSIMNAINQSEVYLNSIKNQQNQRLSGRSRSSRSYLKEVITRKPLPSNESANYQSALSSRGLRRRECDCTSEQSIYGDMKKHSSNFGVRKAEVNKNAILESRSLIRNTAEKTRKSKNQKPKAMEDKKIILLPVIETMPITPKTPDKRSVSAMVRFTKTLPRVCPSTARSRNRAPNMTKSLDYIEEINNNISVRENDKSSPNTELQVVGTRSATSVKTNRWRY